jgi:acetyl esterase/lipase
VKKLGPKFRYDSVQFVGAYAPEFQRQARDFAAALTAAGQPVKLIVTPGYNHYEVGETIGHPYAVPSLHRARQSEMVNL